MWLSRNKEHKDAQDQGAAELQAIRQSMAMIEFTPDGIILDANPAFLGVVNYRLEEIVGKHHRLFCSRNLSESLAYQQFWQRQRQGKHFSDRFPRFLPGRGQPQR
ncbi:MAG: PAS domain S-box protein [Pseudomonadaceae bacterium]|jgi:methyl-accepting chemotaxis protein|nr:PAS domain-containing protein [Pseudomonas sp. ALS1279]TRO42887.1 PAS domain S-box protein [Pseudomonas sp. ALS1279]|tara:strand:+ start:1254 stop:1568 length:315 start_codon:yes stop_codon:yes gene_type:complete